MGKEDARGKQEPGYSVFIETNFYSFLIKYFYSIILISIERLVDQELATPGFSTFHF